MNRRAAKQFLAWGFGSMLAALGCITYIYASPSSLTIPALESHETSQMPVANQPAKLAFLSYEGDNTIKAFWKEAGSGSVNFTIEIEATDSDGDSDEFGESETLVEEVAEENDHSDESHSSDNN